MESEGEGGADVVDAVKFFPLEEVDFHRRVCAVDVEGLGDGAGCATDVAVCGGFFIDRSAELEAVFDGARAHVEQFGDLARDFAVGHVDLGGAEGVDRQADGLSNADGVGHLDECAVGNAGGNEILGDVTGGVCGRAVDFRGVLARECTATVGATATIGVDDDFAAGQPGVTVRSADDKLARRVDVEGVGRVEQMADILGDAVDDAGNENLLNVAADGLDHPAVGFVLGDAVVGGVDEVVVLSREDDGVDSDGAVVVVILDCNLAFGIGAQVGHVDAFAADVGQLHHQRVAQREGEGDIIGRFVGGIAKHHALVTGTLVGSGGLFVSLAVDTAVDVAALFVDSRQNSARVSVKHQLAAVIADSVDDTSGNTLKIDIGIAVDFAGENDLTGGYEGFTGDLRFGIADEKFIENRIADLVGDFVGMTFRH